ncbi:MULTISPECIES: methylglyoxal synthase [unclassified Undibacterium]|uniref:methylglyoxal synthase n=1 Tax=unclassified Undibacterium TaxID=2630295 RepID=UPI002AC9D77C|nr:MULTISPECIES: methylglyoxal synthase [unclassified Undibacterium]MEB0137783.1 methylglyoxal synthase [Undibacterium sp. CCC2.1]MEB0171026.1 methylglyoxal synthase [Undibacterium sp. CCC1.1]MEB0175071.1 methylglyoxal synthase [Undibacterium sp. CCC3.4]MEB0215151.1 methylglyoxal synthase [Undibacterium sp. 5I2]WPX44875.1 methylglyoxal synthase [Undibacterium sp. CCC3.4]
MTLAAPKKLRIGLIANRRHQEAGNSALVQLCRAAAGAISWLQPEFVVIGRTLDALSNHGLISSDMQIERFPYGRDGGLMKLVARVVDDDPVRAVDAVIYLIDPVDPSSIFPEAVALKRQCVIHKKPFLATLAGAREWLELEACALGAPADLSLAQSFDFAHEGLALIAHDAMKEKILFLAEKHFTLLDQFSHRYATGTTGGLLNELAQKIKGQEAGRNWVHAFRSGPLGGDAQIAELVLERKIRRILFLEDPHVARQHEADIQLLERAARTVTDFSQVVSEAEEADRWLSGLALRARPHLPRQPA